jgi:hypothetical protein
MASVISTQNYKSVYTRFIYSGSSFQTNTYNASTSNYLLTIKGFMIKDENNLVALFSEHINA